MCIWLDSIYLLLDGNYISLIPACSSRVLRPHTLAAHECCVLASHMLACSDGSYCMYVMPLLCQVPEFRVAYQIETDKLDALYKKLKPHGVTMTALLSKACAAALVGHPILHAGKREGTGF
jgi:hypothetical protein